MLELGAASITSRIAARDGCYLPNTSVDLLGTNSVLLNCRSVAFYEGSGGLVVDKAAAFIRWVVSSNPGT